MLAPNRLFHNFCTIVKERNETRRTKNRRMIRQFCRDQLRKCLSTNQPKDDRTFRASTSIISWERARTFYAISVVDDDRYFKNTKSFRPTREVLSTHHIWYDWRQPKHSFLLMKNSQWSRKIENGGNMHWLQFYSVNRAYWESTAVW